MSDSYLMFVPKDPSYIPESSAMDATTDYINTLRRKPESHFAGIPYIEHYVGEDIELFHGMELFRIPSCRCCKSNITEWWNEKMDYIWHQESRLGKIHTKWPVPCCGQTLSLPELDYQNCGAFGCYALICNDREMELVHTEEGLQSVINTVEKLLKTPVNIVWQYI
ncbi:hypothetical protein ID855_19300 [Xenorhabdus sp. ZM]|uniref:hypothetical protein n=2 Tax=Xenorhabdus szentirmaii TaxID=290112 RepID=UPI0019CD65F1|nr:hypothetical protein [Xenorhabdus sp. ZM]MBD2806787.1 hypothetical protein [Xenorhabdus sp. ZM]